MEPVSQP